MKKKKTCIIAMQNGLARLWYLRRKDKGPMLSSYITVTDGLE